MTLSSLAPRRGELLWDIGAGSGSVAIEWMLADPPLIAPSRSSADADRARAHRAQCRCARRAASSRSSRARRPTALAGLRAPDAIFVGGGAERPGVSIPRSRRCAPGGRLVVNAVTLETEALLIGRHAALGRRAASASPIARAGPVGAHDRLAPGDAGDAMGLDETMIVARRRMPTRRASRRHRSRVRAALAAAALDSDALDAIATIAAKGGESGIRATAAQSSASTSSWSPKPICWPQATARETRSERVLALTGVPSVAEAAALAAAGPAARLIGPRLVVGDATCALAAIGAGAMTVHFIGAGPGAADLITVRGRDLIARCPVCLYAGSLVPRELAGVLPAGRPHRRHRAAVARRDRGRIRGRARRRPRRGAAAFRRSVDLLRARASSCAGSHGAASPLR